MPIAVSMAVTWKLKEIVFGLLVLWGVVARSTKLVVIGLVGAGLAFLWWYGMTNGWLDGRLGPPS